MNLMNISDIPIRGSPGSTPVAETQPVKPAAEVLKSSEPRLQPQPERELPESEVEQAAGGVNAFLKSSGSHIQFALHKEAKQMMLEVIDDETQQVVKTIPAKELLDLAAKIGEMVGMLLDKKG